MIKNNNKKDAIQERLDFFNTVQVLCWVDALSTSWIGSRCVLCIREVVEYFWCVVNICNFRHHHHHLLIIVISVPESCFLSPSTVWTFYWDRETDSEREIWMCVRACVCVSVVWRLDRGTPLRSVASMAWRRTRGGHRYQLRKNSRVG